MPDDQALIRAAMSVLARRRWIKATDQDREKVRANGRTSKGRPPVPKPCPRCGMPCAGTILARDHCRKIVEETACPKRNPK